MSDKGSSLFMALASSPARVVEYEIVTVERDRFEVKFKNPEPGGNQGLFYVSAKDVSDTYKGAIRLRIKEQREAIARWTGAIGRSNIFIRELEKLNG